MASRPPELAGEAGRPPEAARRPLELTSKARRPPEAARRPPELAGKAGMGEIAQIRLLGTFGPTFQRIWPEVFRL